VYIQTNIEGYVNMYIVQV